jgi:hypothetical protein
MSSTTIIDPSGESPIPAYNNDRNLTKDVLLFVENSNLAESKGLMKVNMYFRTADTPNYNNLATGSFIYFNLGRIMLPFAATLKEFTVAVSETNSLDASNFFTIKCQKASYTTAAKIPEAQFSDVVSSTITVDGTAAADLVQSKNFTVAFSANDTFRMHLVITGAAAGALQLQAVFETDHV